jgi:GNAT superfamily N-acetyltransferase
MRRPGLIRSVDGYLLRATMVISIRRMTVDDIAVSQDLLWQLGYPLDALELRRRYDAVARSQDHAVMVAAHGGRVVALCHMFQRPALDKPPEAVVQALVVDQASRGQGIGKLMMAAAETWAVDRGFRSIALASHVSRSDAHAFYESIGYRNETTSHQFRKSLEQPG